MTDRLTPRSDRVYVVRWVRVQARPDVGVRYFTRQHDAERFAAKLRRYGRHPVVFGAPVTWQPISLDSATSTISERSSGKRSSNDRAASDHASDQRSASDRDDDDHNDSVHGFRLGSTDWHRG